MIYSGGISISDKEIEYVNDALVNGWDRNHDNYIKRFEHSFAEYLGVKHARTTSGGTQALTLALAALDIGEGDEVIIPDLTYFACSDVVKLLGATPVFVDVDFFSWCVAAKDVEAAITPRTKAIMPVWKYGNAPEIQKIIDLGKKYKIPVVEDACPAVGTMVNGQKAGSFGTFGCFSFHGSKIMTTGFGGMIVTNDTALYEKVLWLNNHCESTDLPYRFWQSGIGYTFDMTNVSAAMGLAQLQRIDEFVAKKRQIYSWYASKLGGIGTLNYEMPGVYSNMWMTSIILPFNRTMNRDNLIAELKKKEIDTRPFFFPISDFGMYKKVDTPIAHYLGYNGLNLPSGVQRTEEEIAFISSTIKELLCA